MQFLQVPFPSLEMLYYVLLGLIMLAHIRFGGGSNYYNYLVFLLLQSRSRFESISK
jgi:hypothetical protein